ncbi:MAG: hypothetical protein KC996_10235 [Phycisphaerales bacterium]|nr:hypothetical protein [Phycisphaerales bacterium]
MKDPKDIPISRAVGRFFGHIVHAIAKPAPADTATRVVSKTSSETPTEIAGQKVVLRKTTIEEVEFRSDQ